MAAARAAAPFCAARDGGAGLRGPLSTREAATALALVQTSGMSQLAAGAAVGVSQSAVSNLLRRKRLAEAAGEAGCAEDERELDPLRNVKRRTGGRPSGLTDPVKQRIVEAFEKDPFGGVRLVSEGLRANGLPISRPTLYRYLKSLRIDTYTCNNYAQLTMSLIHGLQNHVEAMKEALSSGKWTHANFAYADQTPIYCATGHKTGKARRVLFGECGDTKEGKKIGNLWAVVTVDSVVRAWLTDENGNEESTRAFFLRDTLPPGWLHVYGPEGNLFDILAARGKRLPGRNRQMILCIDRLGKSGRSEYCVAGHHAPQLRVRAREAGVGLLMLPPKGALVNPIELWNLDVKRKVDKWQPDGEPEDDRGRFVRGPRTVDEARQALRAAVTASDKDPKALRHAYHARAAGQQLLAHLEGSRTAAAVAAERAEEARPPFDVWEVAIAPRCRMSTEHAVPKSATVCETYNVYYYQHQLHGLHEGLPAPWRRETDEDGYERSCRLCKPNTVAAKKRDSNVLCCESCPGVFHLECLGRSAMPKGRWECCACAKGEAVTPRVWQDPKKVGKPPRKPRVRRGVALAREEGDTSEEDDE